MELHSLISVTAANEPDTYLAEVDITDIHGQRYAVEYVSRDGDEFGLAPVVRAAIGQWIADGKPVLPYVEPPAPPAPDRVTARQFKLQLLADGILDQVEGWIATQSQAVQIAYANSGTFVRDEPMMQAGFAALGFTPEQIDAFFTAADRL
ncbi:hypothetical protein [Aquamicrobium defluvii]|uniref:Uncharacterized protein n=1 Tax=Aquamicrobium defluvii TaxID=69279 RepID=A0A011TD51_9HYPH|nr:hypothetical protein [Aquamicrobium defluvii]EXL09574.1 hypothetical protein BG36_20775 [Aquamicrobium defluvii]EZQ16393.1 hypothetical protein CF98_40950 [Halopseudomonas bauzanensis]